MRLSYENIRGRTVTCSDGKVIGEVSAISIDSNSWRVETLQLKLNKEIADQLGADRTLLHAGTLDLPVWMIQSVADTVVLSVPVPMLRDLVPSPTPKAEVAPTPDRLHHPS